MLKVNNQKSLTNDFVDYEQNKITNKEFKEKKEDYEKEELNNVIDENNIYPFSHDPKFNLKIASKKEFSSNKYPDYNTNNIEDFKKKTDELQSAEFSLAPHQIFVKNFLSFETPYNSLLLYHGLGSGKTCTAIGVAEEMRNYLKQINMEKKILFVASPNVQENFKLQLFDERKLKKKGGLWYVDGCTGNSYIDEVNPTQVQDIPKDKLVGQIKGVIKNSYSFMGYKKFSNFIDKLEESSRRSSTKNYYRIFAKKIKKEFNNRLLIIDEVHNIKTSSMAESKKIATNLLKVVKVAKNLHLLFLSATPMYNNYKEIIWLLNVMNLNDEKSEIYTNEIFDENGNFVVDKSGDIGRRRLIEKSRGYISFVRGENPYMFPHRIFPSHFEPSKSYLSSGVKPRVQINGAVINDPINIIDLYEVSINDVQEKGYNKIKNKLIRKANLSLESNSETLGYSIMLPLLKALTIVFPTNNLDDDSLINESFDFIGDSGLLNVISYDQDNKEMTKTNFNYNEGIESNYGRIFSLEQIGKYSAKIENVCKKIKESKGISIVYCEFIEGGLIPMALALEELGYTKYDGSTLFSKDTLKSGNVKQIDALTNKSTKVKYPSKYVIISGDPYYSGSNIDSIKAATNPNNTNGEEVKVILLSRAGSEGLDFKNVRNIHILNPWYNMSRPEQIIGRGVRNMSHKDLDFEHRNTSIYLYGSKLSNEEEESVDNYIYRIAEKKAIQIGKVSRILKENSVDCMLNINQTKLTADAMNNMKIPQKLSNGKNITYELGDKPKTASCDYMDNCDYKCVAIKGDSVDYLNETDITENNFTLKENFLNSNKTYILKKIMELFTLKYFYNKKEIIDYINREKSILLEEIEMHLSDIVNDKNFQLLDRFEKVGSITNVGQLYFFQPIEIKDNKITLFNRITSLDYKHNKIRLNVNMDSIDTIDEVSGNDEFGSDEYNKLITQLNSHKETNSKSVYKLAYTLIEDIDVNEDIFIRSHLEYLFDYLPLNKKVVIINYLLSNEKMTEHEVALIDYLEQFKLEKESETYFVLEDKGKIVYYILKDNGENKNIEKGEDFLEKFLAEDIKKRYLQSEENVYYNYTKYIGFLYSSKNKTDSIALTFRLRKMTEKANKGMVCEDMVKKLKLNIINSYLSSNRELIHEDKERKDEKNYIRGKVKDTCFLMEMLFRYYNASKKEEKMGDIVRTKWFMNPIEVLVNKKILGLAKK
jgi:hypothetical protein